MEQRFTKLQAYQRSKSATRDDYGEKTISYTAAGEIEVWITYKTYSDYRSNNFDLSSVTHVGIAKPSSISLIKGDKIGTSYQIEHVTNSRRFTIYYLKELQNK